MIEQRWVVGSLIVAGFQALAGSDVRPCWNAGGAVGERPETGVVSEFCSPGAEDKELGCGITIVGRGRRWGEVGIGGGHRDSPYSKLSGPSAGL